MPNFAPTFAEKRGFEAKRWRLFKRKQSPQAGPFVYRLGREIFIL